MTKKQITYLILAFLLGLCLAELVAAQSKITGPDQMQAGTLATFEITPSQEADWTVRSVATTDAVYQTDTSTSRLYFATPQPGTYHIIAAIVIEGKPQVLAKTFVNCGGDEIKPLPPGPNPPVPPTPLAEWITTQWLVLLKSPNAAAERLLVADCFTQTITKIDNDTIKSAQNARTQLQIALTMTLAFASETAIEDWQPFLTELSKQMAKELGSQVNDLSAVKNVFQTVATALSEKVAREPVVKTASPVDCPECQNLPVRPSPRLFRARTY